MYTAASAAQRELWESANTSFLMLLDAIKAVEIVYETRFRQLTNLHEIVTGDNHFEKLDHVLSNPLYNALSKALNASSDHDV